MHSIRGIIVFIHVESSLFTVTVVTVTAFHAVTSCHNDYSVSYLSYNTKCYSESALCGVHILFGVTV
jgi:hypothetical protein